MIEPLIRFSGWLRSMFAGSGPSSTPASYDASPEWRFAEEVMAAHHFTKGAQDWLRATVRLRVDDLSSTRGGGYWQPATREVRLFTAQHEAAVHELAHAWWHYRREQLKDEMIEATVRLSAEKDQRFAEMQRLAFGYVHGIPEQPWEGLLVSRNDWEMFAGFASGTMGDMSKMPHYMQQLYAGLFEIPGSSTVLA